MEASLVDGRNADNESNVSPCNLVKMSNALRAVKLENTIKTDFQTKDQLIGRDASEKITRIPPVFKNESDRPVKFGRLKEILNSLK